MRTPDCHRAAWFANGKCEHTDHDYTVTDEGNPVATFPDLAKAEAMAKAMSREQRVVIEVADAVGNVVARFDNGLTRMLAQNVQERNA